MPVRRDLDEQLHEVRASLAGMLGAIELLSRSDDELPAEYRRRLTTVLDEELRRVGRVLEGSPAPAHECSVDEALEPIVTARRLAGQDVRWKPSGCRVLAGNDRLAEAVNILLVNADQHVPGATVYVEVSAHGKEVHICVTDEGPGIPAALRARLFEASVRGARSPGSGLGLAVARRLATEVGGDLQLRDAGPGASFLLRLPTAVPEACE